MNYKKEKKVRISCKQNLTPFPDDDTGNLCRKMTTHREDSPLLRISRLCDHQMVFVWWSHQRETLSNRQSSLRPRVLPRTSSASRALFREPDATQVDAETPSLLKHSWSKETVRVTYLLWCRKHNLYKLLFDVSEKTFARMINQRHHQLQNLWNLAEDFTAASNLERRKIRREYTIGKNGVIPKTWNTFPFPSTRKHDGFHFQQ